MPPASDPTATTWIEALDDAAPLRAVFGSQALSSNRVELLSLMVDRDGPTVTLGVELTDFPAVPPAKWVGCNTVHADIVFMAVEEFDVTGFARQMTVELDVQRSRDGRLRLTIASDDTQVSVAAGHARVGAIAAYRVDD